MTTRAGVRTISLLGLDTLHVDGYDRAMRVKSHFGLLFDKTRVLLVKVPSSAPAIT